jgi:hypothetical protein
MHKSTQAIREALGYATFQDMVIHNRTLKLLDRLGTDLTSREYIASPEVEIAIRELIQGIDNYDREAKAPRSGVERGERT